jgi:N-acetylmuramoyl-L-alanine amidase
MRWIEEMRQEPSDPGGSFFLALCAANQTGHRDINRRRLCRLSKVLAAILAIVTSIGAIAQTAPDAPRFVVVLDAAHGGDDAGASLGSDTEKAYTLALSIRLRSLLAARGFSVVTTRESDAAVDPNLRAEIANHAGAQACLSLHAAEDGSGVHLFVSSLAPAGDAGLLPWKTAQAAWIMRSMSFAGVVNSALSHASIPVTLGRLALPAIDSMTCPAVTVEVAPMRSNDAQGHAGLDDPDYQSRVADALAAALVEWRSQVQEDQQH